MLKPLSYVLALSVAVPAASQQIDWPKVNDEAMRNYQSLVQVDSTMTEVGVAAFVKKILEAEGVAVSTVLSSAQTFVLQSSSTNVDRVYRWLLGSLAGVLWPQVTLILPYVLICIVVCVAFGRALNVLSVGDCLIFLGMLVFLHRTCRRGSRASGTATPPAVHPATQ